MTVLECMAPRHCQSPEEVFRMAKWFNDMAKRVHDRATRRVLYRKKDECIKVLTHERWEQAVFVVGDSDRHRGLLSIGLKRTPRKRLHFHENWLPAA